MTVPFGKYQLIAELGHGGMGDVYLAVVAGPEGTGFRKLVVIKRLRPHLGDDPEAMAMLLDEARLAARLNHPNVVQTNEVGQVGDAYFIAMELLEGQPLHRVHVRAAKLGKRVPFLLECRLLADVLAGLHHAHELADFDGTPLAVVHRDVTPHNVFITYDGIAKVVDFGIAKSARRTVETKTGVVKGKITYMAPEQALTRELDRRVDVFAVGAMLYEAATRSRLWQGVNDAEIARRVVAGDIPRSPRRLRPDVPAAVEAMCQRALAPNPRDRYATAADLQNDLEAFLESPSARPFADELAGRHATTRALGRFVDELFASERAEMRATVDRQIASLGVALPRERIVSSAAPVTLSQPSIALPRIATATMPPPARRSADLVEGPLLEDDPAVRTAVRPELASELAREADRAAEERRLENEADAEGRTIVAPTLAPSIEPAPSSPHLVWPNRPSFTASQLTPSSAVRAVGSPSEVRPIVIRSREQTPVSPTAYSQATLTSPAGSREPVTRSKPVVAFAATLVGVLGTAALLLAMRRAPTPDMAALPASSTSSSSAEPPPSAAPAAPETIALTVRVTPLHAKLVLDDGAPQETPFEGRVPRDGQDHVLRAEADGYASKEVHLVFDKDAVLEVTLERAPKKQRRNAPVRAPKHRIDTTDPWH
jgi:serine/threonine-protein kinase